MYLIGDIGNTDIKICLFDKNCKSVKISFIHPISKKTLVFDTHLPEDIRLLKKDLESII